VYSEDETRGEKPEKGSTQKVSHLGNAVSVNGMRFLAPRYLSEGLKTAES
jgi:hypothetical protein